MKRADFIKEIGEHARKDWKRSKILPSITIAQAVLESGWGQSGLTRKANNLFGVKTGRSMKGKGMMFPTKEFYGGKWVTIQAEFRAYPSTYESIVDHGTLLQLPRYTKVRGEMDYKKAADAIWRAGYATDPNYPALLIRIIEQFKLYEYDRPLVEGFTAKETTDILTILTRHKQTKHSAAVKKAIASAEEPTPLTKAVAEEIIDIIQIYWGLAPNRGEKAKLHALANAVRRVTKKD